MTDHDDQKRFELNNWQSLQSFISIVLLLIAGIIWALKLEARIDSVTRSNQELHANLEKDLNAVNVQLARGVLPITAIRLEALETRIKEVTAALDECVRGKKP